MLILAQVSFPFSDTLGARDTRCYSISWRLSCPQQNPSAAKSALCTPFHHCSCKRETCTAPALAIPGIADWLLHTVADSCSCLGSAEMRVLFTCVSLNFTCEFATSRAARPVVVLSIDVWC